MSLFLENLVDGNDLSLALSHFMLSFHEKPELGLGEHVVSGEDSNPVEGGVGILLTGELSSDDVILAHL